MERRILHFRVISFAVAVARVRDPSLRGKPIVVAAGTGPRAFVLAVSEEARGEGIMRGIALPEALRRCRRAVVLPPDPDLYARASSAIVSLLARFAPAVEPQSGGRFFADVTGTQRLFGPAVDVASRIQKEIRDRLRLPANAGVAVNKLVSGVAAKVLRPVGLCDVLPGEEEIFLRPVAVGNLPAVDPEVEGRLLSDLNVVRVGQLAALPRAHLAVVFGRAGPVLHRQAHGQDDSPVRPPARAIAVEEKAALPEDTNDDAALLASLYVLIERGCRRLRRERWFAGEAEIAVRYSDGIGSSRRVPLRPPLDRDLTMFARVRPVFEEVVARRGRVRSLTLRLGKIGPAPAQLWLFPEWESGWSGNRARERDPRRNDAAPPGLLLDEGRERALLEALDRLRGKYGEDVIHAGRTSEVMRAFRCS